VPIGETCAHATEVSRRMNIALTMTRQEIADYLGLTIETVSRVVSDLRHRGLVTVPKLDELVVNDICAICRLATADSAPLDSCAPPLSPKPSTDAVW
jgi:transcriptional regulator with XRE-family HTH domain